MGAGVKKSKAKKMQAKAAAQTTRKVKGRNRVARMSRTDKPKGPEMGTRGGKPSADSPVVGGRTRARSDVATRSKSPKRIEKVQGRDGRARR
jgi:hypothetical protein